MQIFHSPIFQANACWTWHGIIINPLPRLQRASPSTSLDKKITIYNCIQIVRIICVKVNIIPKSYIIISFFANGAVSTKRKK
jgi:hypothetical protein